MPGEQIGGKGGTIHTVLVFMYRYILTSVYVIIIAIVIIKC